jgi:hypothetical protein
MSAAVIMAMLGCSCSSAAGLFYTCTDGTLNMSNLNANTCFSFLSSNTTPAVAETVDMGINCQYITVEQTTSNAIMLSDIEVYDLAGASLIVHAATDTVAASTVEGATDENGLASFIDDEGTGTATLGTAPGTEAAKAKVVVDLGGLKKVHKVVLTNTDTTADQSKIAGAKLVFSGNEVDAQGVATKKVIEETPTIDFVASAYTYAITSDLDKWK